MIQEPEPQNLLCSNSDSVKSSAMQKKIRRKYFKNDAAIKDYKCDLISQNLNTPVKLYVCHSALNLVHRPKRKILTTLPFSQIIELKVHDERCVNIYTTSNETYTLANFERPDSAIAFLRNYWEVILKEKSFSTSCGNSPTNRLLVNSNDFANHRNAIISDLYNQLLISKGSTTVSLTSTSGGATGGSISNSETESVVGIRKRDSSIHKSDMGIRKPLFDGLNRVNETNDNFNIVSPVVISSNNITCPNPIVNNSYSPPTVSNLPMKHSNSVYQHKVYNNDMTASNISNSSNKPNTATSNPFTISTDWNWWPLNVLTYMFSATPSQRFTMIIAYAILGFLFLSTIHLYHRLALIDLQTGPAVRRAGINPVLHTTMSTSTSISSELHSLEAQLSHLTQLASKMIEGLSHLTSELNSFLVLHY
ncbi:hypothetical protein KSF78_0009234 [Schistosoma japonicum]|nr:hypothetical protein KSF78_0009234 [Schistosoma japonicum]KAH8856602.1 hypothetical protein KSF78_0009234 [Schistosoma japonicum]KAH8856603.1 hypothetical protein KSF78_0009234 [Schistosoma japonicum]